MKRLITEAERRQLAREAWRLLQRNPKFRMFPRMIREAERDRLVSERVRELEAQEL